MLPNRRGVRRGTRHGLRRTARVLSVSGAVITLSSCLPGGADIPASIIPVAPSAIVGEPDSPPISRPAPPEPDFVGAEPAGDSIPTELVSERAGGIEKPSDAAPVTAGRLTPPSGEPTLRPVHVPVEFATGPSSPVVDTAKAALAALNGGDAEGYRQLVADAADATAAATGLDGDELASIWSETSEVRMRALLSAITQVGVGYRYASSVPGQAYDCSGLVSWAWAQSGVDLDHQSSAIIGQLPKVPLSDVQPGDVLWYPGHVSLALGIGHAYVDSPNAGNVVRVDATHSDGAARRLKVGVPV